MEVQLNTDWIKSDMIIYREKTPLTFNGRLIGYGEIINRHKAQLNIPNKKIKEDIMEMIDLKAGNFYVGGIVPSRCNNEEVGFEIKEIYFELTPKKKFIYK